MSLEAMKAALEVLEGIGLKTEKMQNAIALLRQALDEHVDLAKVGEVGVWGHKREWVGLSDVDRVNLCGMIFEGRFLECIDAIEAKLKEKNCG